MDQEDGQREILALGFQFNYEFTMMYLHCTGLTYPCSILKLFCIKVFVSLDYYFHITTKLFRFIVLLNQNFLTSIYVIIMFEHFKYSQIPFEFCIKGS